MTDIANPSTETEAPWPPQAIVTSADFRSVEYNSVVRDVKSAYDNLLEKSFMTAARASRGQEPAFSVFRLLASVCGLHFRPHSKAGIFGAKITIDGGRSPIPEDWLGGQNEYFFEILEEIEHPALQARLADVVWTNDRKKRSAAAIAVKAYCQCVERLQSGKYEDRFQSSDGVSMEQIDLIERASQIHVISNKRTAPMDKRIVGLLGSLYDNALKLGESDSIGRIAKLLSRYSLITMEQLAADMEFAATAAEIKPNAYPLAIKELWDLAAFANGEVKRPEDQRR